MGIRCGAFFDDTEKGSLAFAQAQEGFRRRLGLKMSESQSSTLLSCVF